jgi:uncharacterized protein YndB with AHSA1/START domain
MSDKGWDAQVWLAGTERVVRRDGERVRAVVVRRRFAASIERVWTAWTEGWRTKIAKGEARPGQTVVLDLGQPQQTTCRVLACEEPTRLAVTWTYGEVAAAARPDEVEVRLTRDGDGTWLELEHRSESGAPWASGIGAGWEAGLLMFDFLLRGDDLAKIPLPATHETLDATWTALVDGGVTGGRT